VDPIVVDASVVVALYLEEPTTAAAREVLSKAGAANAQLHAPDLLLVECANAMSKRVRRGELDDTEARTALDDLLGLRRLVLHPMDGPVTRRALSLALENGLSAYDAIYVALAERLKDGVVVSGDRKLVARAQEVGLEVVEPSELAARL
jgi:predicted nucleic acid-binding protein